MSSDSSNIQLLANIALFHVVGVEYHAVNSQQIRLNSENPMLFSPDNPILLDDLVKILSIQLPGNVV